MCLLITKTPEMTESSGRFTGHAGKQTAVEVSFLILVISSAVFASLSLFLFSFLFFFFFFWGGGNLDIYLTINKQTYSRHYYTLEATLHCHSLLNTFLQVDEFQTCSHDNLRQDLADRRIANPVHPVLGHYTSQERQPAAVSGLPNEQPHQPPKQRHAEDQHEQIKAASGDHR